MDVSMPKLDGIKATREIKKINKEIKVIMLSMHDDDNYIKASKEAGADGYIIKSSDPSAIIEKVKQLI